jgi:hypothetical protein
MKWLLWKLPSLIHGWILSLTGWRLYQVVNRRGEVVERGFTTEWPLPSHPLDAKFPVNREGKTDQ